MSIRVRFVQVRWAKLTSPNFLISSLFLLLTFLVFGLRHISPGYSDSVSAHVIPYFLPALQENRRASPISKCMHKLS